MSNSDEIKSLIDFLSKSVCNFLAVDTIKNSLSKHGFSELDPANELEIKAGDKFFVTKNDSAIFAVSVGSKLPSETGFKIISAHSDSPCFRIKPNPEIKSDGGIVKLNTEVYGGPILYTWFDRPLSLAGRVILKGKNALHPVTKTVKIADPILIISHLAIHFNRSVNEGNALSKQKDMLPILTKISNDLSEKGLLLNVIAKELAVDATEILDFDLMIYDTEKPCLVGLNKEFISAGRLDDLSMVHAAIEAIKAVADKDTTCIAAIFDNEETGSGTKQGAHSPVLTNLLKRIALKLGDNEEGFYRAVEKSFMISADNAHAFHPNYGALYDPTNHPSLGDGPVIKINSNCKYMTDAHSAAIFKSLCDEAGVQCQYFVNHSDVAGGSTLGNIFTGQMPIEGVDVGNALLAMHSVRELGSVSDHISMIKVFKQFFC